MIEVSPEVACMLYLILTVIAILLLWLRNNRKTKHNQVVSFSQARVVCEFCHASYIADSRKGLTRCPDCHFLNKPSLGKK